MFKKIWKGFLKRKITIIMVPFTQARVRQVKFPIFVLLIIGGITAGLLSSSIFIITRYINYYRVIEQNKSLRKKIDVFASESVKITKAAKKVYGLELSLQKLLGMKSKRRIIESSAAAIGGPSDLDEKTLGKVLAGTDGENKYKEIADDICDNIDGCKEDFTNIEQFISEQRSLFAATPRGNPVNGGWITSEFGRRSGLILDAGGSEFHKGIDIANDTGTPIRATASGVIVFSGRKGGYGNMVVINHGYGYTTIYAHNSKNAVSSGDKVKMGQIIAYIGETGNATGPHLHYEVRRNDMSINPNSYLEE